ncbi:MAG: hypothetical protein ACRD9S_14290 [Pyrinomonadaceae bacterium]
MNCEDFETNVNDLAREQVMEATVRADALTHRDECDACARRLEDESALSFRLRALATDTNAVTVPALGSELLTALRSRQATMVRPSGTASWQSRAVITAAMAVAAMVLVVIAVAVIRSRSATPAAQNPTNPSNSQRPVNDNIAKAPDVVPGPQSLTSPKKNSTFEGRRRHTINRTVVPSQSIAAIDNKDVAITETTTISNENSVAEITTDFMPVGYTSAANLQDGGQLVRVELPRSALVAFGLPMNFNRYDEKVKADVFFGSDGMARAIRFVQ